MVSILIKTIYLTFETISSCFLRYLDMFHVCHLRVVSEHSIHELTMRYSVCCLVCFPLILSITLFLPLSISLLTIGISGRESRKGDRVVTPQFYLNNNYVLFVHS